MTTAQPETLCRSCGGTALETVLSLGRMPLANALLTDSQLGKEEARYPLDLAFCRDCALVQILQSVDPELLFREYIYFSSFSDTIVQNAKALASRLIASERLGKQNLVVEVASNDGYLLQFYHQAGIPVLGIEPAANIARVAREERGIRTIEAFFGEHLAQEMSGHGEHARILHANNVLGHVPDLNGFVRGIRIILEEDGLAVIEVPYVKDLIEKCEFDTIYHEHLCYYSLTSLDRLVGRHSLIIQDVERIPIHGGTLRLYVRQGGSENRRPTVQAMLEKEAAGGITSFEFYHGFGQRVEQLKNSLRSLLLGLKQSGKRIAAYGAAAKGAVMLNYTGIGSDLLDFVVDRSPYKQGHYMPGVHIPIFSPAKLEEAKPDYVLLLAWNFADEVLKQQAGFRKGGGKFIIPVPEVKIV